MSVFTFHNVSINTGSAVKRIGLLIGFTFHNVSINTETREAIQGVNYNTLHSTMFLLIRKRHRKDHEQGHDFTFHNVSINTRECGDKLCKDICFTFHNVSINTVPAV